MTKLKRTPLLPLYEAYGGKTIDFGGWELPVQFAAGIMKEHEAVRQAAGLFDVSHMGEFRVTGDDAESFLQSVMTNDVSKLEVNQAQYSLMCYTDGGTVDDLLIYKLANDHYMLVVNASNIDKDLDWLQKHVEGKVRIENISAETALLALQGPLAEDIIGKLADVSVTGLGSFRFVADARVGDVEALVSRTGYTGEDGFELYVRSEDAISAWEQLMEAGREQGLLPIGLGARDTLRFEARLPLYGQELSSGITPIEAGLGFFVRPEKGDFIGRAVLAEQKEYGAPRKLVGVEMIDRGIPRSHYPVLAADGSRTIGEVTTGTQSPTLKKNVGLALIQREFAQPGAELIVEVRGKSLRAQVVATPFYRRAKQ